ncbi:MAG: hypothetical protein M0T71_05515 [Actinomycetota bacterium]|nr:hypothetical protein [Actinomycetota bacterium]
MTACAPSSGAPPTGAGAAGRVVRVVPDVRGLDRVLDYALPDGLPGPLRDGTIVRVPLQGRRVRGWVVGCADEAPERVSLRAVLEVVSAGPPPAVVELARWAAWRYAGRLRPLLLAGSPPRIVPVGPAVTVPAGRRPGEGGPVGAGPAPGRPLAEALASGAAVLRLPPASPRLGVVTGVLESAPGDGAVLVVVPGQRDVARLSAALAAVGWPAAALPEQWAAARDAPVVVGTRDGAFAPVEVLRAVVVLDAHAEALVETRAPTWRADVVALERGRRAGVPVVLVSACPTPEQVAELPVVACSRAEERAGWAPVVVLDRRGDDPRTGRYAAPLAERIRAAVEADPGRPVVCVLNRTGRARLLACGGCGELARCTACGAAVREAPVGAPEVAALACPACGSARPRVCAGCGGTALRVLRVGTARAVEELASLVGRPVAEVSGPLRRAEPVPQAPVLVGTEAVLHRVGAASLVVFLDLDQELLAPRLDAGVRALALLALASRLVGGRRRRGGPGGVVVQTRLPGHEVVQAAVHAEPGRLAEAELARRRALALPPSSAVALVTGEGLEAARHVLRAAAGCTTARVGDRLLVRAADAATLADGLAGLDALAVGVRVEVDPVGL